jgi:MFS family permease
MNVDAAGDRRPVGKRLPYALAACFGLTATMISTFPIVAPVVTAELRLTYAQTGVITAAYMLGYGLFQLPAGFLGIAFGGGRVLTGAMALMTAAALLPCVVESPASWVVTRFVMGIAGATILPLSIHLLTLVLSGPQLTKGIGLTVSGWGIGMTIAMLGAAPLLDRLGWRSVMLASVVLGVAVVGVLLGVLPAAHEGEGAGRGRFPRVSELVGASVGSPPLNLMSLVNAAGTTIIICVPAWLPLYLSGAFGITAAKASASLSPIGLGMAFGAWMGGTLAIRFGWRRVVLIGLLLSALLVTAIPAFSTPTPVVVAAIATGCIGMFFAAPIQSLFPYVIAEKWTALAAGYYNTLGFIGAFSASLLFGIVVDRFATFSIGWLLLASAPLIGGVALSFLSVSGRIRAAETRE